jgi:hypothetical protein
MEHYSGDLEPSELFMKEMRSYLLEYEKYLGDELAKSTVRKHTGVISFFIDELNARYGVTGFEQITLGMCGSKLVGFYNSHCRESLQLQTAKNILYRFFRFIYDKHGIANHELLQKLKK